ncbi:MAG TPA: YceI family protein [Rubricoccaceae bacterium]
MSAPSQPVRSRPAALRPRLALVVFTVALLGAGGAARPAGYTVDAGSRFRIDGTSTLGRYSCAADAVTGSADVPTRGPMTAEVTVGVGSFDCGQARMNRDFRRALQAEGHPEIRFDLDAAEALAPEARPGAWVPVRATGRLSLAGAERAVVIVAEGRRLGQGRVRLRGQHPMRMTDFGVAPPSGMLGMVRAHDRIVVRFDLTATSR